MVRSCAGVGTQGDMDCRGRLRLLHGPGSSQEIICPKTSAPLRFANEQWRIGISLMSTLRLGNRARWIMSHAQKDRGEALIYGCQQVALSL